VLSIGKLSAGQERYYLDHAAERVDVVESVAGGAEDYYLDPVEARGRWLGAGAAQLGLAGDVGPEQLRRVLAGLSPATGEPLRQANGRLSVSGYDLTFSAPKSISLVYGLGNDKIREAVREAHDRAVREAIGYLERTAAGVRRGHGGAILMPADGLVAATFRHRSSRAADPQLHTHVVVANLARGSDGRWSTLDGRRIYAQARAASFIYQAVLRGELTAELGLSWQEIERGIADIDGVPEDLIRAFSTRRGEIESALAEHDSSGPRAAEAAALATRKNKDRSVTSEDLLARWRAHAGELGWGETAVAALCQRDRVVELEQSDWERLVGDLISPRGLTLHRSSFTRSDVVQALAEGCQQAYASPLRGSSFLPNSSSALQKSCP
jgi:conjugative relaxase-like TrwC/TraI family protein